MNERLGAALNAVRILSFFSENGTLDPGEQVELGPYEWAKKGATPVRDEDLLELLRRFSNRARASKKPFLVDRLGATRDEEVLWQALQAELGLILPIMSGGRRKGCILVLRNSEFERFEPAQMTFGGQVAKLLGDRLDTLQGGETPEEIPVATNGKAHSGPAPFDKLVESSQAVFLTTDCEFHIAWASRRAMDFFGETPENLVGKDLRELVHPDDREYLGELKDDTKSSFSFEEEFRLLNRATNRERTVLLQCTPLFDENRNQSGWTAIGIDLSSRAEAQAALETQTKKVQALYSVSAAIRGHLDPVTIGNRGVQAVLDAVQASAAVCYLCPPEDPSRLTLVAHRGFGSGFSDRAQKSPQFLGFARTVAEGRQPVVVQSLAKDKRFPLSFSQDEGMKSAVLVPILIENEAFGTLGLFDKSEGKFGGSDVLLLSAAASQIGLSARQANLFTAYRRQTRNLLAIYRISHELSALKSLEEVFEQAFQILRDELGLKRLWVGLLSEGGTTLTGTAAFGPGWKRKLIELVIGVRDESHPLAEVVKSKRAMIVENPQAMLGKFGLERFFTRFGLNSLALAPLVTRGEVLGVLAAQPGAGVRVDDEELGLLSSIASEIAALINTRRLEEKISESEKTQSMALLAAGIAHNFNNVLQAVLGQASLLEMQKLAPDQVERSAKSITESATRGATLVRQLLSVANLEEARRVSVNVNDLLRREQDELVRLIPPHHTLKFTLKKDLPKIMVDPVHLHRILHALVKNAVEALRNRGFLIQVFSDSVHVDGRSLHFEVPEGDYVRVGVRDNGIGMDAETKRRCFDPFFSTKNVDPGTGLGLRGEGLGLAAAFALARKNGGRLTVDSRPGQGSLFTLYIPSEAAVVETKVVKKETSERTETTSAEPRSEGAKEEGETPS